MIAFWRMLGSVVKIGDLTIVDPSGRCHSFGDGTGEPVKVRIKDRRTAAKLLIDPDLYTGEAYMDGRLEVECGTIYDFLCMVMRNFTTGKLPAGERYPYAIRKAFRRMQQHNPVGRAQRNVAHHYDLSGELYDLFLDRDRQYSCGYFEYPNASLAEAQLAKKRHLAAKLQIEPGMKVLDIGSGWGGLGLYLAEVCGADVTGVTLSQEQYKVSCNRARQRDLADQARFQLIDYRNLNETFDRVVSVGMFEHVGVGHYHEFAEKVHSLLADDGVGLVHSIGRSDGPGGTSAWITKYIFPGGYIPALSEVVPAMETSGLYITDIEILRIHYAQTIKEWRARFADHRDRAKSIYDERFCRMWEFYLAASEASFRYGGKNNFQVQFARNQDTLALTRDYMQREEERLRAIDSRQRRLKSVSAQH